MEIVFNTYTVFNLAEGLLWIVFAISLPVFIDTSTARRKRAIAICSVGFLLFASSDFAEVFLSGETPPWLWVLKIVSGLAIFCSRFYYLGWNKFRWGDKYVLFGLFCILSVLTIIFLKFFTEQV